MKNENFAEYLINCSSSYSIQPIILLFILYQTLIGYCSINSATGESEIANTVINESNAEEEDAKKFLEEVRISFPQVCLTQNVIIFFVDVPV